MPPPRLLLFFVVLTFLVVLVQFGLVAVAFEKLGLSRDSAYLLLLCTLVGSTINLPLFTLKGDTSGAPRIPPQLRRWAFFKIPDVTDKILIVVNVGGAVVPVAFSLYLITHNQLNPLHIAIGVAVVAILAAAISRPIPGTGIGMPMLVAPFVAAVIATLLDPEQRAPLAYIGGTLGVLIGADLMHLDDIRKLGRPVASIGGAGTFDGVFITGLFAVLLA